MDTTNQNAESSQYLICIGGWGSTTQVFDPLISECPELQKFQDSQKIELRWQDFVGLPVSARRSAMQNAIQNALARKVCNQSEISDVLVLAWSLGSMLALELALAQEFQPQKNESLKNAKGKKNRLRLILLSGTAAMCRLNKPESKATENANNDGNYPFVSGAVVTRYDATQIIHESRQQCCKTLPKTAAQTPIMWTKGNKTERKKKSFIPFYLGQAAQFFSPLPISLQSRDNEETSERKQPGSLCRARLSAALRLALRIAKQPPAVPHTFGRRPWGCDHPLRPDQGIGQTTAPRPPCLT